MSAEIPCKVCGAPSRSFLSTTVLRRHETDLHECTNCGFIFMDPVTWLDEAYQSPITALDLGYVDRNLKSADFISGILNQFATDNDFFVDYGGGTGLFVRLMRDRGFRFHIHEPYTDTFFSKNCFADVDKFGTYRALCAIEVFEHLPDPVQSFEEMVNFSRTILFTTELYPKPRPDFSKWWYTGLEHGQHVSFHSEKSLENLAFKFGLTYKHLTSTWHLIGPNDDPLFIDPLPKRPTKWEKLSQKVGKKLGRTRNNKPPRLSLIQSDYEAMKQILRSSEGNTANPDFHLDAF